MPFLLERPKRLAMVKVNRVSRIHLLEPTKSNVLNVFAEDHSNGQFSSDRRFDRIKKYPPLNSRTQPHQSDVSLRARHSSPIKSLAKQPVSFRRPITKPIPYKPNISMNSTRIPQIHSFTNPRSIHLSTAFQPDSDKNRRRDRQRRGVFPWWKFCFCCLCYALLLGFGIAALIVALIGGSTSTTSASTNLISSTASVTTASTSLSSASSTVTNSSTTTVLTTTSTTSINSRLNVNLLINGDGETGPCESGGSVTHPSVWTYNGTITQLYYNNTVIATVKNNTPGPSDRGNCFFFGGSSASTSMRQTVNLTDAIDPLLIDNQTIKFNLSAWLGGWQNQDDNAQVTIIFYDQANQMVGNSTTIGPVLAADRNNITSLIFRQANDFVPIGARSFITIVTLTRVVVWDDDAVVDNIAVALFL